MRVRLYLSTWPLADGASPVNLKQLADSTDKLALEIPPLVRENMEEAPPPLGGLVRHHQDILITARGKGHRKSRCTHCIGAPAWY